MGALLHLVSEAGTAVSSDLTIRIITHSHSRVPLEVLSATFILLEITWE